MLVTHEGVAGGYTAANVGIVRIANPLPSGFREHRAVLANDVYDLGDRGIDGRAAD